MLGSILVFGFCSLALARGEGDLPARVDGFSIDPAIREEVNKLPTADLRIARLSAIVEANNKATNETQNLKASSAIRLLGVIKSTNSISILVSNLTFVDTKYHGRPAVEALAAIGKPAMPQLLDVLKDPSESDEKCVWAVEAMKLTKGANGHIRDWLKFMDEQRGILPKFAWERFWRTGSIID